MIISVPKEIKPQEDRVSLTPAGVQTLTQLGQTVYVQEGAGVASGFSDEEYIRMGAQILSNPRELYLRGDMVVKVKEPLPAEYGYLRPGLVLFTYLHLAPEPGLTKALLDHQVTGIAYETVQTDQGHLPLLVPMSEVAGRMSVQVGAHLLEHMNGGRGVLLGGVPGVEPANVTIIGGGNVGTGAAKVAAGMGARVTVVELNNQRLTYLDDLFGNQVVTLMSNSYNIAKAVKESDLVIGAVLLPGAKTPVLVTEEMVKTMRPGSVIVDVAIDQGGCIETADTVTTHENPYYVRHGVLHYSVANMPGAVPRTSTFALTNATLPYVIRLAQLGAEGAMQADPALLRGLNTYKGQVTYQAVAEAQGLPYTPARELL